jgi:hypothetical protein
MRQPADASTINRLRANVVDPEGQLDRSSVTITEPPAHGTVTPNGDGTVTYVHDGSATATDTFRGTIKDIAGAVFAPT